MEKRNVPNPENCMEGVRCEVNNCCYNDHNNRCTAKEIKVGPQFASCSGETACATFKLK